MQEYFSKILADMAINLRTSNPTFVLKGGIHPAESTAVFGVIKPDFVLLVC